MLAAIASGSLVGFTLGLVGGGGSMLAMPLLLYTVGVAQPHIIAHRRIDGRETGIPTAG